MKSGRIQKLLAGAAQAFQRFPHVIICSVIVSVLLCFDEGMRHESAFVSKLLMVFSLGVPLYLALAVFDERYTMRRKTVYLFHGLMASFLFFYWLTIPAEMNAVTHTRYLLLICAAHLCVSLAPFAVNGSQNGFWQYNRLLLSRFITCSLFSLVLFAGLGFSIYCIEQLFHIQITHNLPAYIFFILITLNTWFFLIGVPENVQVLDADETYPVAVRVFAAYVLLPLVILFFIILYAYSALSLAGNTLDENMVSQLIIALSIAGLLCYLLLWPLRNKGLFWIEKYNRLFFPVLLPLVIVLAWLNVRELQYSFLKAEQFMLIVYCISLAVLALYFTFNKYKFIRTIPIVFIISILIAGFGPWNAFESSRKSVVKFLTEELEKSGRLKAGKFISSAIALDDASGEKIRDAFYYIDYHFSLDILSEYLPTEIQREIKLSPDHSKRQLLLERLNISGEFETPSEEFHLIAERMYPVKGYEFYYPFSMDKEAGAPESIRFEEVNALDWKYDQLRNELSFIRKNDTITIPAEEIYVKAKSRANSYGYIEESSDFVFEHREGNLRIALRPYNFAFKGQGKSLQLVRLNGHILFTESPK